MGNHRLYLDESCEGMIGKSTKYKYDDEVLEIEWHGERAWFHFPQKSAVLVKCEGAMPDVLPLTVPANFRWRTLWLCGVPKPGRCASRAEFEAKVIDQNISRISEGDGWKIAWKITENGAEYAALGWISGKIHDRDVMRMVDACNVTAPEWFIRQVLGFEEKEGGHNR